MARIHHFRHHKPPHHHRQPLHLLPMSSPSPSLSDHTHHKLQLKIVIPILMMIVTIIKPILVTLFYDHHHWQPLTYLRRMISSSMATSSLSTSSLTSLSPLAPPQTQWTVSPSQSKTSYMTQSTPSETPASTATTKPPSPILTNLRSPPAIRTDPSPNPFHCLVYPSGKTGVTMREKEMKIRIERETTARS